MSILCVSLRFASCERFSIFRFQLKTHKLFKVKYFICIAVHIGCLTCIIAARLGCIFSLNEKGLKEKNKNT